MLVRPPSSTDQTVFLPDEKAATRFAKLCAGHLNAGDTVLLSGPIGAGKSHFARAVIRAKVGAKTEVPSPTFTLVQSYADGAIEIWHADLYRVSDSSELTELGLFDAMGSALCLIEWPDRLGDIPSGCITIDLSMNGEGRTAHISGASALLTRALQLAFTA